MSKTKKITALLIALLILLALPAGVLADPGDDDADEDADASSSGIILLDVAQNIVGMWGTFLQTATTLITQTPDQWSANGWEITQKIHGTDGAAGRSSGLKPIAVGIMLILWAISFFRHVDGLHKIDAREVMSWVVRFMLIYAIIEVSFGLMETILLICARINDTIMAQMGYANSGALLPAGLEQSYTAFGEAMNDANWLSKIWMFLQMLVPLIALVAVWIVVFCCGLVVVVTLALRFFKMYIYAAIAPIPLATFAGSETQDIGKHFLKNWFAVCLEVSVIAIAVIVFTASMVDESSLFPGLEEAAQNIANLFGGADPDDVDAVRLFQPTVTWGINIAVKVVLLASITRGADQISQKIVGAG
ncbi:MAG: hypothetical protein HDQ87_06330 [Clostridia bacterium]|nr:hypothetical protein [Clostridia bacterium]